MGLRLQQRQLTSHGSSSPPSRDGIANLNGLLSVYSTANRKRIKSSQR